MSAKPPEPASMFGAGPGTGGGLQVHAFQPRGVSGLPSDPIYSPSAIYAAAAAAQAYLPFGAPESSAFYPPLGNDGAAEAWRSFSAAQTAAAAAAWAYDPTVVGFPYGASYGALDVRRKNATRESTSMLKQWLYEHIKNPYPTKGEKIMLAIITKMTLTQVSTWFANARRRLKKENKMQWSPRNRTGDDDDDDDDKNSDDDVIADDVIGDDDGRRSRTNGDDSDDIDVCVDVGNEENGEPSPSYLPRRPEPEEDRRCTGRDSLWNVDDRMPGSRTICPGATTSSSSSSSSSASGVAASLSAIHPGLAAKSSDEEPPPRATEKPRIWSLADVATSGCTPSSGRRSPPNDSRPFPSAAAAAAPPSTLPSSGGFQPWTSALTPPHHLHGPQSHPHHHPPPPPPSLVQHRPLPPNVANGLMRYGPFPVVIGMHGGPQSMMTSHPAAVAVSHQLAAAAAAHAAAVSAAVQARLHGPPLTHSSQPTSSSSAAGPGGDACRVPAANLIVGHTSGSRSPPTPRLWPSHLHNGNAALQAIDASESKRSSTSAGSTSRDGSPISAGPTPTLCAAQTAFKPVTPRRL